MKPIIRLAQELCFRKFCEQLAAKIEGLQKDINNYKDIAENAVFS